MHAAGWGLLHVAQLLGVRGWGEPRGVPRTEINSQSTVRRRLGPQFIAHPRIDDIQHISSSRHRPSSFRQQS